MKKSIILIIALVSVLVLVYAAGALYFNTRFPLKTKLNGADVSGLTVSEAASSMHTFASAYELTGNGREGLSFVIKGTDVDLSVDYDSLFKGAKELFSPLKWPVYCIMGIDETLPLQVSFSEDRISDLIKDSPVFTDPGIKKPENAFLDVKDGKCVIVPEVKGNTADLKLTANAASKAISLLEPVLDLDSAGVYQEPTVHSDDRGLLDREAQMNKLLGVTVTLDFEEGRTETVDPSLVFDWIVVNGGNPGIDPEAVSAYVESLARKYNTIGRKRAFTKHDGTVITLPQGPYGWRLNQGATAELLTQTIEAHEDCTIEPVWTSRAKAVGDDDIGDTYVEIDLDAQHVWAYQGGAEVVSSDCVSGKAINGSSTPEGLFPLTYKERNATLRGDNYESHVDFWMPFNGNVGMHDASWRSEFGGVIYVTSGSHGCVNLPRSAAAQIYDIVEKDTPVIVYGGMKRDQAALFKQQQDLMEAALLQAPPEGEE